MQWIRFLDQFYFSRTHPGAYLHSLSLSQQLEVLNSFLAYLYFDKGVSPRSIGNFLAAVRFKFQTQNAIADFLNPSYHNVFSKAHVYKKLSLAFVMTRSVQCPFL